MVPGELLRPPQPEDYFNEGGTHNGGGCVVITPDRKLCSADTIYNLPIYVPRLEAAYGGLS